MLASDVQFVVVDFECTGSVGGIPTSPGNSGWSWPAVPLIQSRFSTLLQVGRSSTPTRLDVTPWCVNFWAQPHAWRSSGPC